MLHTVLALFLAAAAPAQPALPDTPAGKALGAWLAAFNSGDPALIRAYDETYRPPRPLAEAGGFREATGGFNLIRVEKSEPTTITALVQEKASDTVGRFELSL
ncbi:MAG TPA: hypothetical protein VG477_16470, partial [Thermoanaerobaculia bacterium]|nr:hypothetical protein [Thermoanaerobaculia bacterium]